jgi:hypothetical protein
MALGNEPRFVAYGADSLENLHPVPLVDGGGSVPVTIVSDGNAATTFVYSTDFAAAGNHVVWTPAAGKRVVLLEYSIELTGNAAATVANSTQLVKITDDTTDFDFRHVFFVPTLSTNTPAAFTRSRAIQRGLMFGVDAPVQANLSHALSSGRYYVTLVGYEV